VFTAEAWFRLVKAICGNGKVVSMFAIKPVAKMLRLVARVVNPKRLAPSSSVARNTPVMQRVGAKMHLAVDAVPYKQQ
jgi:hypothetical protein